jgi:hypothetical protein
MMQVARLRTAIPALWPRSRIRTWCLLMAIAAATEATAQRAEAGRIDITGDIGTRAEFIRNENFAESDLTRSDDHRFRSRLRLRLGGRVDLGEGFEAQLRLSTGSPSYPTSAWTTPLDFRRHPVQVDRAFIAARFAPWLHVQLGAGPNQLFTPTELVWDSDVQPAGVATRLSAGRWTLAAGQYVLREARSVQADNEQGAYLLAHGLTYSLPTPVFRATVGVAEYRFVNPHVLARSLQLGELDADFRTNRFDPRGRVAPDPRNPVATVPVDFFSGFQILNVGFRADFHELPVSFSADLALNRAANRDPSLGAAFAERQRLGYGAMVRFGKSRDPWDWTVGAGLFRIEADAVLAILNSDDLQQTNVRTVPLDLQLVLPGAVRLTWDSYLQRKLNVNLPSNGGIVHDEDALKVRTRLTASVSF